MTDTVYQDLGVIDPTNSDNVYLSKVLTSMVEDIVEYYTKLKTNVSLTNSELNCILQRDIQDFEILQEQIYNMGIQLQHYKDRLAKTNPNYPDELNPHKQAYGPTKVIGH